MILFNIEHEYCIFMQQAVACSSAADFSASGISQLLQLCAGTQVCKFSACAIAIVLHILSLYVSSSGSV
jgi:hypothetical protein